MKQIKRRLIQTLIKVVKKVEKTTFPEKAISYFAYYVKLFLIENELKEMHLEKNIGALLSFPHKTAIQILSRFLRYNPNNLGTWSNVKYPKNTKLIEKEVIKKVIHLYHASQTKTEGYLTSGATEGNIFSSWLGRAYLQQYVPKKTICLLRTSLTHYSVQKAADILDISQFIVGINNRMQIDGNYLENTIIALYKKGYRGFIISLTHGYTVTGTSDDDFVVNRILTKLKDDYSNIHFYCWIDAASDGWVRPFLDIKYRPFRSQFVHSLVVDMHKFGLMPYSAGFVLFKSTLKKGIERRVEYLAETDTTLLGSRQGAVAIAIWGLIHTLGKKGFKNIYVESLRQKNTLIKAIKDQPVVKTIYTDRFSLTCSIELKQKYFIVGKDYLNMFPIKLTIINNGVKIIKKVYKIHLLPHVTPRLLNDLIATIKNHALYGKRRKFHL